MKSPAVRHGRLVLVAILAGLATARLSAQPASDQAREILRQAIAQVQDKAFLEQSLGKLEALAGEPGGETAVVHYSLGWVLSNLARPAESAAAYRRAIALQPDLTEAHYNLGVVLTKLDDREGAIKEFDETSRLDPESVDALYNSGQANYDLERYGAALAKWRAVQKRTPDDFQVARKVLQALNALGLWEEAAGARDETLRIWREKRDPAAGKVDQYCFDQIPLPPNRVYAYEYFTPTASGAVWSIKVVNAAGKIVHVILLSRQPDGKHVLLPFGAKQPEPLRFADQPTWREIRPIVREWARQLLAAGPGR